MTSTREDMARKIAEAVCNGIADDLCNLTHERVPYFLPKVTALVLPLLPEVGGGEAPQDFSCENCGNDIVWTHDLGNKYERLCVNQQGFARPSVEQVGRCLGAKVRKTQDAEKPSPALSSTFAESLVPRGAGGPRCPKCKSLALTHFNFNAKAPGQPFVRCCECFEVYPIRDLADFAQFFPASSPEAQPTFCLKCGKKIRGGMCQNTDCSNYFVTESASSTGEGWTLCADRLPEQSTAVLIFTNEDCIETAWLSGTDWICERSLPHDEPLVYDLESERVTHWHPLPLAPEGKEKA